MRSNALHAMSFLFMFQKRAYLDLYMLIFYQEESESGRNR